MQYTIAESLRQTSGSQDIYVYTQETLGLELNGRKRHQGRARAWVDEQIEIAAIHVVPSNGRAKDARSKRPMTGDDFPQFCAMNSEGF